MTRTRLSAPVMLLALLPLLGAPAPADAPSTDAPVDAPPPEAPPAEATETPAAEASTDAAPEAAPAEPETGEAVLQRATQALAQGRYDEALLTAIPAISTYPELAPSFRAIADLAADQLERRRDLPAAPPVTDAPAYPPARGYSPTGRRPPSSYGYPPGYTPRPRADFMWGFDFGLPTGVRVEWKLARRTVDSWGFRFGGNFLLYGSLYPVTDMSIFADFRLSDEWQLEVLTGPIVYYGWLYGQFGVAAQYDPPTPLQVNVGARIAQYGAIMPDLSVGFVW